MHVVGKGEGNLTIAEGEESRRKIDRKRKSEGEGGREGQRGPWACGGREPIKAKEVGEEGLTALFLSQK